METSREIGNKTGLTEGEQRCMDAICAAWGEFIKLPETHPNEIPAFLESVHRLQELLAIRIVRRDYPEGWPTFAFAQATTEVAK